MSGVRRYAAGHDDHGTRENAFALGAARLSVAPMMDWTDRHCRYLHRMMSRHTLLYTEMITSAALVRGKAWHLLTFDPAEHPVAVQLGGSDPGELAEAAAMAADSGYDEINLNVGCPSDRVQSGRFGAVLMKEPALVADCVAAMSAAQPREVTVKCRIGVDEQVPGETLPAFIESMRVVGVRRIAIHARKAWLKGLSPKENRDLPPLKHPLVYGMKQAFPDMFLSINGGIGSLEEVRVHLARGMDGVMVGRAAYNSPCDLLLRADSEIFGDPSGRTVWDVVELMRPYIAAHLEEGGRLHGVTKHMLGMFTGCRGVRAWRRTLSELGNRKGAGLEVMDMALAHLTGEETLLAS